MKILIGCEESGTFQKALIDLGHQTLGCDLQSPGHNYLFYKGDIRDVLNEGWDAMIAFPPCTYLAKCQMWKCNQNPSRMQRTKEAVDFVKTLWNAPIDKIIIENPPGFLTSLFAPPDQTIHPFYFGDPYRKETNFWLKNVPRAKLFGVVDPTKSVSNHVNSRMSQEQKSKIKSSWSYFPKMTKALALQWFDYAEYLLD